MTLSITGTAQKTQIPENAKPVNKEFSITVSAQPQALNGNSVANMFFNGLTFGVGRTAQGGISAIIDLLKAVHWDLGECVFRLTDSKPEGYRVVGEVGKAVVVCSLPTESRK